MSVKLNKKKILFIKFHLQMGIGDIFEPNRANFRPMTDEKSTYVRHIEQTINIHIHTHPINQLRRKYIIVSRNISHQIVCTDHLVNQPCTTNNSYCIIINGREGRDRWMAVYTIFAFNVFFFFLFFLVSIFG